jgi:hypothetical protein
LFNCQVGLFPIKYLGVPVSPSRLRVSDWSPLLEKCSKRLDVWKGGTMSIAGRTTLISYKFQFKQFPHISYVCVSLPKTVINKIETIRRNFFWQGGGTKRKYHLVKWEIICKSKKNGGLGLRI